MKLKKETQHELAPEAKKWPNNLELPGHYCYIISKE